MGTITIRSIQPTDNAGMAKIIRNALEEFGAHRPGTVYFDDSTDHLYELFAATHKSCYFIALQDKKLIGGAGIFPTAGLPDDTCELVKMYLCPSARGMGLGRTLIMKCLESAAELGFANVYLETMPELKKAVSVYEKFGFTYLSRAMGHSGHTGCAIWMIKKITPQTTTDK